MKQQPLHEARDLRKQRLRTLTRDEPITIGKGSGLRQTYDVPLARREPLARPPAGAFQLAGANRHLQEHLAFRSAVAD